MLSEEDQATVTGNVQNIFVKFSCVVLRRTCGQTDTQTRTLIAILRTPHGTK